MKIKNYLKKTQQKKNNNKTSTIYLKNNILRFKILASALAKYNITILSSKDETGSYYEKNIILPKKINITLNKKANKQCYIYKILFSLTSSSFNFYNRQNKDNYDYKIITSIITIKNIHRNLFKEYNKTKELIKFLYPIVNKTRPNLTYLTGRQLLIEIIIRKLTYEKPPNTTNLTDKEKLWLFNLENTCNVNNKNMSKHADNIYQDLCDIHKKYTNIKLYLLWGYLYEKNDQKIQNLIKNKLTNQIKKKQQKINKSPKQKIIKIKDKTTKNLNSIFDYKKTYDNYTNGNKSTEHGDISENINPESLTKTSDKSNLFIKSNIIKHVETNNTTNENNLIKKVLYKEWDYKKNVYKNNWCHLFIKNLIKNRKEYKTNTNKINTDIRQFQQYFKIIINKKIWQNKKTDGNDIDIDSIIDNFNEIKNNTFNKVYKHKKKIMKNISILILIDSSLSTESYINNEQTFKKIKTIANIMASGFDILNNRFLVATFYSNTRYDCRYLILKNFKDKWRETVSTLDKLKPNGYTRIGPAIRHSISILKKTKAEKKVIILLSDGTPTDYDEYEGLYGLNDIKKTINESNKNKIALKSILINNCKNQNFKKIFGSSNCYAISDKRTTHIQLVKLLKSLAK